MISIFYYYETGGSSTLLKAEVKVINHVGCSWRLQVPAVIGAHVCAASTFRPTPGQLGSGPCTVIKATSFLNKISQIFSVK